jgi:1-phosphofructokinase
VADAARRLAADSGMELLVSMGGEGAIHTDGTQVLHGSGPVLVPVNTAGAGDAFLAGWLAGPGSPQDRMTRALGWGRSACLSPTTVDRAPGTRGVDGITVTTIHPRA